MPLTRRRFLKGAAAGGVSLFLPAALVACGDSDEDDTATPGSGQSPSTAAATTTAAATSTASATRGPSKGELRVAEPFLPTSLDADSGSSAFNLQALGVSECLMRFGPDLQVQPWIASKLDRLDDLTWRVTIREDVTFWDGTRVDAEAVRASLQRSMEKQPGTADQLPPGTVFTASGFELIIKTPVPIGLMPFNLANPAFSIKKPGTGEELLYTGPFRVTGFTAREFIELDAYQGYRGGPAAVAKIKARQVADANARALALLAGDVHIAQALLPSDAARLKSAGLQVFISPWARQHMVVLNVKAFPFDDVAVRRAFALAVDRDALVKGVMEGAASPALGIAPEDIGLKGILRTQKFDLAEADRILDAAGWEKGSDGVRSRAGKRLAFKLGTYAGRAELEQAAVVLVDMLKAAGMDATIEKTADVEKTLSANEFQAHTYSIGPAAFGDISRLLATLYVPSSRNKDRYANPEVISAFQEYLLTSDAAKQLALLKTIQEKIAEDVPIVHLFNPRQVVGAAASVKGFAPHPLDSYKYGPDVTLQG
jgi:peptide/nickel transport system substrate-binding protein